MQAIKNLSRKVQGCLEHLTDMKDEDMMPEERILYSSLRTWYSHTFILVFSAILIILSMGVFLYGILARTQGIGEFILKAFSAIFFFGGIIVIVNAILRHYDTRYFLTSYRVIKRRGIITKNIEYAPYSKIQNVKVKKNLGESLVDMGDVHIDVAGGDQVELIMEDVPDPEGFHQIILQKMHDSEERDGL